MSNLIHVTDEDFESVVLKSEIPVVVDFWATWCVPCKVIAPHLEELSNEYAGKVKVCKVNLDNSQQTAMTYGIRSIPTVLFFKDGKINDTIISAVPKAKIEEKLKALL